jgi:hypothetical protein
MDSSTMPILKNAIAAHFYPIAPNAHPMESAQPALPHLFTFLKENVSAAQPLKIIACFAKVQANA